MYSITQTAIEGVCLQDWYEWLLARGLTGSALSLARSKRHLNLVVGILKSGLNGSPARLLVCWLYYVYNCDPVSCIHHCKRHTSIATQSDSQFSPSTCIYPAVLAYHVLEHLDAPITIEAALF